MPEHPSEPPAADVTATPTTVTVLAPTPAPPSSVWKPTEAQRTLVRRLCYLGMGTVAFPMGTLPILLTQLQSDFGLDDEEAGRITASAFIGTVTAIMVVSPLADRYGVKPFVLLGTLSGCLGFLLQTYSTSYLALLVAVFLEGAGVGLLDLLMSPIVAAMYPEDRTTALQWLHLCYSIGSLTTLAIVSGCVSQQVNWRLLTTVAAAIYALVGAAFYTQRIPSVVADEGGQDEPWLGLLHSRLFWVGVALVTLGGASELGPVVWIPAYFEHVRNFKRVYSDFASVGFAVMMATGRFLAGKYATSLGYDTLLGKAGLLCAALVVTTALFPVSTVAAVAASCIGLSIAAMWPTALAIAGDCHPNGGAKMFGLLAMGGNCGGVVMPWLVGLIADRTDSLTVGFLVCAVPPLLLSAIEYFSRGDIDRRRTSFAGASAPQPPSAPIIDHAALPNPAGSGRNKEEPPPAERTVESTATRKPDWDAAPTDSTAAATKDRDPLHDDTPLQ